MMTTTNVGIGNGGMLRARRRDVSVKPNRKLDRKSSRGMIYENEELRLRTININAEVEQGQNDIKKLRRENEQLRRDIWLLRDKYTKLEDVLKNEKNYKIDGLSDKTSTSSCSSNSSTASEATKNSISDNESCENESEIQKDDSQGATESKINSDNKLNSESEFIHDDEKQKIVGLPQTGIRASSVNYSSFLMHTTSDAYGERKADFVYAKFLPAPEIKIAGIKILRNNSKNHLILSGKLNKKSQSSDDLFKNDREISVERLSHSCQDFGTDSCRLKELMDGSLTAENIKSSVDVKNVQKSAISVRKNHDLYRLVPPRIKPHHIFFQNQQSLEATSFEKPDPQTLNKPHFRVPTIFDAVELIGGQFLLPAMAPVVVKVNNETQTPLFNSTSKNKDSSRESEPFSILKVQKKMTESSSRQTQKKRKNRNKNSESEDVGKKGISCSKRKMAVQLQDSNGKSVPWCACWGNGCI